MRIGIQKPKDIPKNILSQLIDLISLGSQVDRHFVETGIPKSFLIAMMFDDDKIVSTATLKRPLPSYKQKVFRKADVEKLSGLYGAELGYIVTHKDYEGNGYCQQLLKEFMLSINNYSMYATTRKASMIHILGKHGFKMLEDKYDSDLSLLVFNHPNG